MMGDVIASDRRAVFQREGWVLVPRLLSARTLELLRLAADSVIERARGLERDAIVQGAELQVQSASGRQGEPAAEPGALRKVVFPSKLEPALARLKRHHGVHALLADLGLPSPRCAVDQLNLKAPRIGTGFPWHQDARFVSPAQRRMIALHGGVNLVIALDQADEGNGGFEVLSGTHLAGPRDFDYDTSTTNEGIFDESRRERLSLRPGDAVAFHPYLAHGSGPNESDRPRRLVALWFIGWPAQPPASGRG